MKRDGFGLLPKIARFTETNVSFAQEGVVGQPDPAFQSEKEGCTDWVILPIQGLKEYLGYQYRKLMHVLRDMPAVPITLGLSPETLPHYSTVCERKQDIPMKRWRATLDYSDELYNFGEVQEIDDTGVDRVEASQQYAKRTDYTFKSVKTS